MIERRTTDRRAQGVKAQTGGTGVLRGINGEKIFCQEWEITYVDLIYFFDFIVVRLLILRK